MYIYLCICIYIYIYTKLEMNSVTSQNANHLWGNRESLATKFAKLNHC